MPKLSVCMFAQATPPRNKIVVNYTHNVCIYLDGLQIDEGWGLGWGGGGGVEWLDSLLV